MSSPPAAFLQWATEHTIAWAVGPIVILADFIGEHEVGDEPGGYISSTTFGSFWVALPEHGKPTTTVRMESWESAAPVASSAVAAEGQIRCSTALSVEAAGGGSLPFGPNLPLRPGSHHVRVFRDELIAGEVRWLLQFWPTEP